MSFTRAEVVSPQAGDWFEYTIKDTVRDGSGYFYGYTEDSTTTGRYDFTAVTSTNFTVHAKYSWTWSGEDYWDTYSGSGSADRSVTVNLTTRNYTQMQTDLVGYDTFNGKNLLVWFLVPANLELGQTVKILEHTFTVTKEQMTVWSNGLPRSALELKYTGPNALYNYGDISIGVANWTSSTSTDIYYVDRDSGFVFAERLEFQVNQKTYGGYYTDFKWTTQYDVTASSFAIDFDGVALAGMIIGITAAIVLPVLGIFALYRYSRWRPRTDSFRNLGQIKISRVKHLENFPQHLENHASDQFGAFLVDFAAKTLLAGGRVAVAADVSKNELLGVAYYNKEEEVGNILCKNTEVTDALRRFVNCKDFFSEVRHEIPADLLENMRKFDNPKIQPQAYNIFETYQVLKLAPIQHTDYDTNFVSYMQEKDLAAVSKVAREVYGKGGKRTFRALLDSGDIGFVARVKGQVVGFAFASFVNQMGRNHTLTVLPKFRNQGIGRELARARLTTLGNLGAEAVITEIADWNLSSLQISNSLGFKKVGVMFVETARSKKIKKTIVRW